MPEKAATKSANNQGRPKQPRPTTTPAQPVSATIDGSQIKFESAIKIVADNINYLFQGTVNGDTMSGDIHLGEYRTAKFTASRTAAKPARKRIQIPGGPPLAT